MVCTRKRRQQTRRARREGVFDPNETQNNRFILNQNRNANIKTEEISTQILEQNILEHIQREMMDIVSIFVGKE